VRAVKSGAAVALLAAAAFWPGALAAQALPTSTPAITVAGDNSVIAVQTSGDGPRFYWNEYGTNIWHGEQVSGNATTDSAPTIAQDGDSVIIAAEGADNSLDFAGNYQQEVVAAAGVN
jgi:hypothetical protein